MDLAFGDRELRKVCEDEDIAIEKYGNSIAEALQTRLADLMAATSLKDIQFGGLALLDKTTFKINLSSGYILVFSANNRRLQYDSQGIIDLLSVTRILILSIESQDL